MSGEVDLDESGYWAKWATWQAGAKRRHVTAIADDTQGLPAMFVSNEVLVARDAQETIDRLVYEGGKVLASSPLAEPPPDVALPVGGGDGFPLPLVIQFDAPPTVDEPARRLARVYEGRTLEERPPLTFTSESGARVAALVAELQADGHDAGLNWLGSPEALPLATANEAWTTDNDPFNWPSHVGSRIVDAWELVEAFRGQRSLKPIVWIAVLDGGFWLNNGIAANGDLPGFGIDLASDTVAAAGGSNPNNCGSGGCPWHGNGVASAAAAAVNNNLGAAGAGGTVAQMVFFKTTISEDQVFKCLKYCTAWGLDVLNMSFAMKRVELFFGTSHWDAAFDFAVGHGVIPIAAAGNGDSNNVGQELPDYNVRPATRTPGTITVGALDQAGQAASFSNYGSSVNIWAPGVAIPVGPDPANPTGSAPSGTSQAAPLVAGVVAMMRAVNPAIDAGAARAVLSDSGWQGTGRVTKGLDAYAAVLAAMGGRLPADLSENNNSPATATRLSRFAPGGPLRTYTDINTIGSGDPDYYRFSVEALCDATLTVEWYPRLGPISVSVSPDDGANQAAVDQLTTTYGSRGRTTIAGVLPPGEYLIAVSTNRPNGYAVSAALAPLKLGLDQFEPNDTFDGAARLMLERPATGFGYLLGWRPGRYDCTLHEAVPGGMNPDFFEVHTPKRIPLMVPFVDIRALDATLSVWLYNDARVEAAHWVGVRQVDFEPAGGSISYVEIRGDHQTRYSLEFGVKVDEGALPGPHLKPFSPIPEWWEGPWEGRVRGPERYWSVIVAPEEVAGHELAFEASDPSVQLTLHELGGNEIRRSGRDGDRLTIDTRNVEPGTYLVRAVANEAAVPPTLRRMRPGR